MIIIIQIQIRKYNTKSKSIIESQRNQKKSTGHTGRTTRLRDTRILMIRPGSLTQTPHFVNYKT